MRPWAVAHQAILPQLPDYDALSTIPAQGNGAIPAPHNSACLAHGPPLVRSTQELPNLPARIRTRGLVAMTSA